MGEPERRASRSTDRFLERFREVERQDPVWGAVHLGAAVAWFGVLGASNAAEGITFGVLCGVAAIRIRSTHPLYPSLFGTTIFRLYLALTAWRALSATWSANPDAHWYAELSRFAAVPLALWPLCHRAGTIGACWVGAAAIISALLLFLNVSSGGIATYVDARTLGKELGMTAACLVAALVTALGMPWRSGIGVNAVRVVAATLIALAIAVLSQRTAFLASIASALGLGVAGAVSRTRDRRTTALRSMAAIFLAFALSASMSGRFRNWVIDSANIVRSGDLNAPAMYTLTGARAPLAVIALEMFVERPIIGFGARSFGAECIARCDRKAAEQVDSDGLYKSIRGLVTSHNMLLDELSMRGAIGGLLLLALVVALWRWGIADPISFAPLLLLICWCAYGVTDAATGRGTHLAILAILVTATCRTEASIKSAP